MTYENMVRLIQKMKPLSITNIKDVSSSNIDIYRIYSKEGVFNLLSLSCKSLRFYIKGENQLALIPFIHGSYLYHRKHWVLTECFDLFSSSPINDKNIYNLIDSIISFQNYYCKNKYETIARSTTAAYQSKIFQFASKEKNDILRKALFALYNQIEYVQEAITINDFSSNNFAVDAKGNIKVFDFQSCQFLPYPIMLSRIITNYLPCPLLNGQIIDIKQKKVSDYYYDHFLSKKGITKVEFDKTLELFIFYDYYFHFKKHSPSANIRKFLLNQLAESAKNII